MSVLDRFGLAGVASAIITGVVFGVDRVIAAGLAIWFRAARLDKSGVTLRCLRRLQLPQPERTKPQCR
jgi:hypothetical protein